jgi:hypothetical protein
MESRALSRVGPVMSIKVSAYFGRDGESRRHWQTDSRHFVKIRAFATQQRFHSA